MKKFQLNSSEQKQKILIEKLTSFDLYVGIKTNNVIESSHNSVPKNVNFSKHFSWLRQHDTDSRLRWDNRFLENRRKRRIPKATIEKNSQLKELKEQLNLNLISFDDYFFQVRKICDL